MKGEDSLGSSPWVLIRHVIAFDLLATRRENVLLLLTRRETSAPFQQRRHLRMRTELLYSSSYHSLLSLWARGNSQANCQLPSTEPRQSGLLFPWTWGFQAEMVFPFCLLSKYGKRLSTTEDLSPSPSPFPSPSSPPPPSCTVTGWVNQAQVSQWVSFSNNATRSSELQELTDSCSASLNRHFGPI